MSSKCACGGQSCISRIRTAPSQNAFKTRPCSLDHQFHYVLINLFLPSRTYRVRNKFEITTNSLHTESHLINSFGSATCGWFRLQKVRSHTTMMKLMRMVCLFTLQSKFPGRSRGRSTIRLI